MILQKLTSANTARNSVYVNFENVIYFSYQEEMRATEVRVSDENSLWVEEAPEKIFDLLYGSGR